MNELKQKYYIALGNLQSMAIDNTKGSKGVGICVLDINEYTAYLQSKIDKAIEFIKEKGCYYSGDFDDILDLYDLDDLLNILQGDENGKVENLDKLLDILKEDK